MKIIKIKFLIQLTTLLVCLFASAQQDPQYTQYMYNMSVINPAYATDNPNIINVGGLYRAQWVGLVGSPTIGNIFAHAAFGKQVEGGISIVHDQIGEVVKETNVYADFAYVLPVSENNKLSIGLKVGATFFSTNFNGFVFSDPLPDPTFANNISRTFPNLGIGAYYFSKNYYIGLSAPNLLNSKHLEHKNGITRTSSEEITYFFTSGYVFDLNENLKFKPAFMSKFATGAPISIDVTANFLINNLIEAGIAYRFRDSFNGLINFRVTPSLRVGYAYDRTISNLGRFSSGSHEILILFDLNKSGNADNKGYDKSPRFF